jgi:glycosyltransferase involved in cell wall biosynthesis
MLPIKVFHIIPTLSSGGAERQLADVVCGTSKDLFSHTVCAFRDSDFFGPQIENAGHKVIDLGLGGKRPWLKAASKINSIIGDNKPDIIHSRLYDGNIASRLVKLRNRKIPLINSLDAADYEPEVIKAANWPPAKIEMLRWIDKSLAMLTGPYFAACSQYVAQSHLKRVGIDPSRMSVIYNLVDPDALKCGPEEPGNIRRSLGIGETDLVYFNVGRVDPPKNQELLLRAFQQISSRVANAHLVILGTGILENSLKNLAVSLNIAERVHFLGRRKDVGAGLEMADVFVFPSLCEGLPLALLEAMAKGLPCIASDIGPHKEVINDGVSGLLVTTGSVEELADSMIRIYNDPGLRENLGKEARKKTEEKFFSSALIPQWESLYKNLSA